MDEKKLTMEMSQNISTRELSPDVLTLPGVEPQPPQADTELDACVKSDSEHAQQKHTHFETATSTHIYPTRVHTLDTWRSIELSQHSGRTSYSRSITTLHSCGMLPVPGWTGVFPTCTRPPMSFTCAHSCGLSPGACPKHK